MEVECGDILCDGEHVSGGRQVMLEMVCEDLMFEQEVIADFEVEAQRLK